MKKFFKPTYSFLALLLIWSCTDNDDKITDPTVDSDVEIQDFIWNGLNLYYYWQGDVADLADDRFSTEEEYNTFLSNYPDPDDFFYYLNHPDDRFSYITDDYTELQNSFEGNTNSNGVEYGLVKLSNSDNILGYVRYILPNSDASTKDIQRGDLFLGVDGEDLNINNYEALLFGENNTYTLNMADISNNTVSYNDKEVELTKSNLTENPVYINKTFDINGQKIGYLMYNGFTANFDASLNDAFGELKSSGISQLVLDLRYNPGGSVNSSANLASMITGQFNDELFVKLRYNKKVSDALGSDNTDYNFRNKIEDNSINSLSLSTVYVLTTSSTASASELIINGLDPYINVIQIGEVTTGKNEASVTLYDSPDFSFENKNLNPNHTWAMQPLVSRNENADGFSDYTTGLVPEIELEEDLSNLGILGDQAEPLLAKAIEEITGISAKSVDEKQFSLPANIFVGSEMNNPLKNNMYIDLPIK